MAARRERRRGRARVFVLQSTKTREMPKGHSCCRDHSTIRLFVSRLYRRRRKQSGSAASAGRIWRLSSPPSFCAARSPREPAGRTVLFIVSSMDETFTAFLAAACSTLEQHMLAAIISLLSHPHPAPSQQRMAPSCNRGR